MSGRFVHIPKIVSDLARIPQANAGLRGERLVPVPIDVELLVLEQFPRVIRDALNQSAIKLNSLAFVEHYNWCVRQGLPPSRTAAKIAEIERNEIAVFAGEYRAAHGYPLPYVAAGATVQRYGAPGPSRHPPRRAGKPVLRAPMRKRRFRTYVAPVIEMAA